MLSCPSAAWSCWEHLNLSFLYEILFVTGFWLLVTSWCSNKEPFIIVDTSKKWAHMTICLSYYINEISGPLKSGSLWRKLPLFGLIKWHQWTIGPSWKCSEIWKKKCVCLQEQLYNFIAPRKYEKLTKLSLLGIPSY